MHCKPQMTFWALTLWVFCVSSVTQVQGQTHCDPMAKNVPQNSFCHSVFQRRSCWGRIEKEFSEYWSITHSHGCCVAAVTDVASMDTFISTPGQETVQIMNFSWILLIRRISFSDVQKYLFTDLKANPKSIFYEVYSHQGRNLSWGEK